MSASQKQPAAAEPLQILKEEPFSPAISADVTSAKSYFSAKSGKSVGPQLKLTTNTLQDKCPCVNDEWRRIQVQNKSVDPAVIEKLLADKEKKLRNEFQETLRKEIAFLKERFDFILHNEQVRASFMLREAYRERQEKIKALQSQLECKNMAGLMYVLCTERKKSKMEKMKLIEQYTHYIEYLNEILKDSQNIILRLSRGYKTAARLDMEWREKFTSIVGEFQKFVEHYMQDSIDKNQYFFDVPKLMECKAPIEDNPQENPIEEDVPLPENKPPENWWEKEGDSRPFVVIGDIGELDAYKRREALKKVRANKTAPKIWKEYAFNEMYLNSGCIHANDIKDVYAQKMANDVRWECQESQTVDGGAGGGTPSDIVARRYTTASIDYRGNMGSIVKLITASGCVNHVEAKATLLGARDSMEILSTTKLREEEKRAKESDHERLPTTEKLNLCRRKTSFFEERKYFESFQDAVSKVREMNRPKSQYADNESVLEKEGVTGLSHQSSLVVLTRLSDSKTRPATEDKVCPMEQCRRMRMDTFMHSLPAYMKVKHLTHIEQTYDNYEACTPEQLEILEKRIQDKKSMEKHTRDLLGDDPLKEWMTMTAAPTKDDVGVQHSDHSLSNSPPPCTCSLASGRDSGTSLQGIAVNVMNLIPMKERLDTIKKECLFDESIEFNRFKVIGEDSHTSQKPEPFDEPKDFPGKRIYTIKKILKEHPSLCSLLQANTKC